MLPHSTLVSLPVLNTNTSSGGGCGSCSSKSAETDQRQKLEALSRELREIVAQSQTTSRESAITPANGNGNGRHSKSFPPNIKPSAESAFVKGEKDEYYFDLDQPLRLVSQLAHRLISGQHLWVAVLEAGVIVLDDKDHELLVRLKNGESPAALTSSLQLSNGISAQTAWQSVSRLIGRLAMAGCIAGIRGYTERKVPTPEKFSRFHLTKACQLECIHCYADSSPHVDRSGELSTERWMKLADSFTDNGGERVLFTGGEALMHKGCVEIMRHSKEIGLHVTLFSNGILVPRFADAIKENVDQMQISLDGPDEASNDLIRGKGTYKRILRAIDTLLEQGTPLRVGMCVMQENWESWKANFLSFAQRYAHTPLEFKLSFGITPYGRGSNLNESPDIGDTQPIVETFMARVNGEKGPRITRGSSGCGYCEQLVVGPDGTVYPCHLLDGPVCHVDDYEVPEIISLLKNMTRLVDVDHVEGCDTCDIRYICGGTCRVVDGRKTGSRLVTTCTQGDKDRKFNNLVQLFSEQPQQYTTH